MDHHESLQPGSVLKLRWRYTEPTYVTTHPIHLDPTWFKQRGIEGVIFDFDNTLISSHSPEIGDNRSELLEHWIRTFGKKHVMIVSNKLRIFGMANKLDTEATRFGIRSLSTGLIIKPFTRSLKQAAALMELNPNKVLMVGDLLLTDILGGKRAGMQTLLVAPVHANERLGIRLIRVIEQLLGYHAFAEHPNHTHG